MTEPRLPRPNALSLRDGLDLARTLLPEGAELTDQYMEADYTFIFPFTDPAAPEEKKAVLVVKPTQATDIIDLSTDAHD